MCEHDVPVAILTKGGRRCLRDLDLFKEFKEIKVGATMILNKDEDIKTWEPNAPHVSERIMALEELNNNGIATWASIEPVIDPEQALEIIKSTHLFVGGYKVSKLNYHDEAEKVDWKKKSQLTSLLY